MVPATTPANRAARAPVEAPETLRKPKLAEAADMFVAATEEMVRQQGLLDRATPVLEAYFKRTGRHTYKDRIAYVATGGQKILDFAKLRAHLGAAWADFQTTAKTGWKVKLLK